MAWLASHRGGAPKSANARFQFQECLIHRAPLPFTGEGWGEGGFWRIVPRDGVHHLPGEQSPKVPRRETSGPGPLPTQFPAPVGAPPLLKVASCCCGKAWLASRQGTKSVNARFQFQECLIHRAPLPSTGEGLG
jgi:hypothetical protein